MSNNDFRVKLGFLINDNSLTAAQKKLAEKEFKTKLNIDLESFSKDKQKIETIIKSLSNDILKIADNIGIEIDDKKAASWAKNYYNELVKGAERATNAQEQLKNAAEKARKNLAEQADAITRKQNTGAYDTEIIKLQAELQKWGFSADEVKLKMQGVISAYDSLKSSGDDQSLVINAGNLTYELEKVKNAVSQIKVQFDKLSAPADNSKITATIIKLNNYLSANTKITPEARKQLQLFIQTLESGNVAHGTLNSINQEFAKIDANMRSLNLLGKSWKDSFTSAIGSFGVWLSATNLMMSGIRTVQKMGTAVHDIDSAMTNLYKVTDETDKRYQTFLTNSAKNSKALGASISSIVTQTSEWTKLGYSMNQAETLAQSSMVYAKVGEVEDAAAVSTLVTAMKAYNIETSNAISIVDKLNELGNNYATSSKELGAGLSNSASALALAGNDIDQTLAMITAMTEITQDASESGNALKILSMRLRGASTELENAGESTEGMATSASKLREKIQALTNVNDSGGFDIMADEDTFKSTYEIMQGISNIWSDMSDVKQAALLEIIAGKQRGNSISALLTNMSTANDALNSSINSSGSAYKEHEKWLESLEAKTKQFEAAFQSLSQTVLDSDFLKGLVDTGTTFITLLDKIISTVGTLPVILGTAGVALNQKLGWLKCYILTIRTNTLLGSVHPQWQG